MKGLPEPAVFDASPLIFLGRVGLLDATTGLFAECLVPRSVQEEVVGAGLRVGAPEVMRIDALFRGNRLKAVAVRRTALGRRLEANPRLTHADRDVLVLASERGARLLADDAAVRSAGAHLGVHLGGTLYVLEALRGRGVLDRPACVRYLDRLIDEGWYCSPSLYRKAREMFEG